MEMVYCIQGQHMVEKALISWLAGANGRRRRMCSDCKNKLIDDRNAKKQQRKAESK